jgi:sRNA-binding protein
MAREKLINNLSLDQLEKLKTLKKSKIEEMADLKVQTQSVPDEPEAKEKTGNQPKKPWQEYYAEYMKIIAWLTETFPALFDLNAPKPIKRHIENDIFEKLPEDGSITRKKLRDTLAFYTKTSRYQQAFLESSHRFDLEGNQVEDIPEDHKTYTQEKIQKKTELKEKLRQERLKNKKPFNNKKPFKKKTTEETTEL